MRSAEELMALREQGMVLTPQEEQKVSDYLAERRGGAPPAAVNEPIDAIREMLARAVPGAPEHLLADATRKFRRILGEVRRAERRRAVQDLVRFGMREAADKLRELEE